MSLESEVKENKSLGIILYTLPTTTQFWFGVSLAKSALAKGYHVRLFAWGDSVYGLRRSSKIGDYSKATAEIASMLMTGNLILDVCTSCWKLRGLASEDLILGAHLSGTHKIPEMIRECHKTLALIP